MDDRYIKQLTYKAREQIEKECERNPLAQYSSSQLKAELRRRKGRDK